MCMVTKSERKFNTVIFYFLARRVCALTQLVRRHERHPSGKSTLCNFPWKLKIRVKWKTGVKARFCFTYLFRQLLFACLLLWQPGDGMGSTHESLLDGAFCWARYWREQTVRQCWSDDASWLARLHASHWRHYVSPAAAATAHRHHQTLQSAVSILCYTFVTASKCFYVIFVPKYYRVMLNWQFLELYSESIQGPEHGIKVNVWKRPLSMSGIFVKKTFGLP